jgi:protein-tyrosine phosphatase
MHQTTIDRRHIPLEGARNVRDLGGHPSRFGGSVRWRRLFRADRLDELTPGDLDVIAGLGLTAIYDLRTIEERGDAPDALPSHHVPMLSRVLRDLPADLASIVDHDGGVRFLTEMCLGMLRHSGPEIGAIMFTLADPARTPMMFHCTAGKDRTGVLAALILEALGVDREVIVDDFELSARFHRPDGSSLGFRRLLDHGLAPEAAAGVLAAPRSVIETMLRSLDEDHGGIERYLTERGGVDRDALVAARASLLE